MASMLDGFFDLGNKATKNNPVRKAQFDYSLYWIVFLSFCVLALTYFYNFFWNGAGFSTLMWGIIISIFCWFNYWALATFRGIYQNMKDAEIKLAQLKGKNPDDPEEMLKLFENGAS